MPTIRDVARSAGVSIKTVSRVLNQDRAVRPETAARVDRAIAELAYTPDPSARTMRGARSDSIGLVNDDVTSTPYAVDIIRGVQDACADSNIMLFICNTRGDPALTAQAVRGLIARKVEGIIFATRFLRVLDELPDLRQVPIILVNCVAPDGDRPSVLPDDEGGSYAATGWLVGLGHRRIALVSINPAIMAATRRESGFRRAMREHDLAVEPGCIQPGQHFDGDAELFTAAIAVETILAHNPGVTAIVCGTDAIAMRVCGALRARGLDVPGDVSVIGFDNFTMITEGMDPPLTSVALPYYDMGQAAVTHLRSPAGRGKAADPIVLPCPLVVRQSCRAPAPSGHAMA